MSWLDGIDSPLDARLLRLLGAVADACPEDGTTFEASIAARRS